MLPCPPSGLLDVDGFRGLALGLQGESAPGPENGPALGNGQPCRTTLGVPGRAGGRGCGCPVAPGCLRGPPARGSCARLGGREALKSARQGPGRVFRGTRDYL